MKETPVEQRLRQRLGAYGFKVLKLTCPGTVGVPDRMILRPKWSPGPPWFVECKRPRKEERLLQAAIRDEWRERGILVLDLCDSYERVEEIAQEIVSIANKERIDGLV